MISGSILTTDWLMPSVSDKARTTARSSTPNAFGAATEFRLTHSTSSGQASPPLQKSRTKKDATERVPPKTTRDALLFHSIERFLEQLQVGGVTGFLATAFDPFLLQSVLE